MNLISLIIVIVVIGVILWAISTYVPMDEKIKRILNIVSAVAAVHCGRLKGKVVPRALPQESETILT